jgi:hypothetical protein
MSARRGGGDARPQGVQHNQGGEGAAGCVGRDEGRAELAAGCGHESPGAPPEFD